MMKRLTMIIGILVTLILTSSCAVTSNFTPTNAVELSQGNFKIVRPIGREVVSNHIFLYGGKKVRDCKEQAIASMSKELKENQALAYINVVQSSSHFIPWVIWQSKVTISAIVVEFE